MEKAINSSRKTHLIFLCLLMLIFGSSTLLVLFGDGELYYIPFLFPLLLAYIYLCIFALDKMYLLAVFTTPLAIEFKTFSGMGLSLPTEMLLITIMILYWVKQLFIKKRDYAFFRHPITITLMINFAVLCMTSITSHLPLVSFKYTLARLWFLSSCYFFSYEVFKRLENIRYFLWLYILPLCVVVAITFYKHSYYHFAEKPANWIVKPFYNDHTSYGAVLAMYIPILIYFVLNVKNGFVYRLISLMICCFILMAIVFSYTRAAWVSMLGGLITYCIVKLKIPIKTLISVTLVSTVLFLLNMELILGIIKQNSQDSSDNLVEHVQSISNVSTDASNLERLNRWNCALRMFMERPLTGWGPGTYSFVYAPFQKRSEKTIISTNRGDGGNAHSEYLGSLSESGIPGILSFIAVIISIVLTGLRLYYRLPKGNTKNLVLAVWIGIITYIIHGFLNNFLDTDKASVPFWGFVAIIVVLEIKHKNQTGESEHSATANTPKLTI